MTDQQPYTRPESDFDLIDNFQALVNSTQTLIADSSTTEHSVHALLEVSEHMIDRFAEAVAHPTKIAFATHIIGKLSSRQLLARHQMITDELQRLAERGILVTKSDGEPEPGEVSDALMRYNLTKINKQLVANMRNAGIPTPQQIIDVYQDICDELVICLLEGHNDLVTMLRDNQQNLHTQIQNILEEYQGREFDIPQPVLIQHNDKATRNAAFEELRELDKTLDFDD